MAGKIRLNVSGTSFEFSRDVLAKTISGKLGELCEKNNFDEKKETLEVAVERSASCFEPILTYYQTGRLHIPMNCCPGAFKEELDYWKISVDALEECCMFRYLAFLDDQETRRKFLSKSSKKHQYTPLKKSPIICSRLNRIRQRIWGVVDNNERSTASKVYFGLVFIMVMVSIITLGYSTEPYLRRTLSKCEVLEYMEYTHNANFNAARQYFGNPTCHYYSVFFPMLEPHDEDTKDALTRWDKAVSKLWTLRTITNHNDSESNSTKKNDSSSVNWSFIGRLFNVGNSNTSNSSHDNNTLTQENDETNITTTTTTTQVTTAMLQMEDSSHPCLVSPLNVTFCPFQSPSTPDLGMVQYATDPVTLIVDGDEIRNASKSDNITDTFNTSHFGIPRLTLPVAEFDYIDCAVLLFFSCDILLRLLACPSLKRYFISIVNILDACALVSNYLYFVVISIHRQYRYMENTWVSLLNYVQIFRVFRLFRVVQNVRASRVLVYSITQNLHDMTLLVMLLFVCISSFASIFYFAESRETVPSIPTAWYWAVVTMTTLGYGELRPYTGLGQVTASLCAISGVFLLAITMPLFVNKFVNLYRYSCINENMDKLKGKRKRSNTIVQKASEIV